MSEMLDAALVYHSFGLHPIPCKPRDKRPAIDWKRYQTERPLDDEVEIWWTRMPEANIALTTGRGLVVVDLDGEGAEQLLWDQGIVLPDAAPRVQTGSGQHVYFTTDDPIGNYAGVLKGEAVDGGKAPQIDIRGDGGYVLAPPSVHPNGAIYEWLRPMTLEPFPLIPERLLELLRSTKPTPAAGEPVQSANPTGWMAKALEGVGEGQRDDTCAKLAGYLVPKMPREAVLAILRPWAARCNPPLPERDVWRVVQSIEKKHQANAALEPEAEGETVGGEPTGRQVTLKHISEALAEMIEGYDRVRRGEVTPFVPSPFAGLNRLMVGGPQGGEVVVLGARPGLGKTALALEWVTFAAERQGKRVLVMSREMLAEALVRRQVSQTGRIEAEALKLGTADPEQVRVTAERLGKLPIWITDNAVTVEELTSLAEAMPAPPDFIVVDYLQLVRAAKAQRERRHEVDAVTWSLKLLAGRFRCPVLVLSSMRRRENEQHAPTMADLRESGEIEHTASIIILLFRPNAEGHDKLVTDAIVAKGRDGKVGVCKLIFRDCFVSFDELDPDSTEYPDAGAY